MLYIFEAITYLWLFLSLYLFYILFKAFLNSKKTKTVFLFFSLLFLIGFIVVFYGSFIEPRTISVKNYDINLNKTSSNQTIKIAAISDTHFGPFKKFGYSQKIADKLEKENPDIVVLLGDYIYGKEEYFKYLEPILKLENKFPIYAITGNHEYHLPKLLSPKYQDKTKTLREILEKYKVPLLENKNQVIEIKGEKFNLAGIKEIWTKDYNLDEIIEKGDKSLPTILLCHNPEIVLEAQNKGLFYFQKTILFISPGIGEIGARARLFDPPEISILNVNL